MACWVSRFGICLNSLWSPWKRSAITRVVRPLSKRTSLCPHVAQVLSVGHPPLLLPSSALSSSAFPLSETMSSSASEAPAVRLEQLAFSRFQETLQPPLATCVPKTRYFEDPKTKGELMSSIACLDFAVDHNRVLVSFPPRCLDLDKKTCRFLENASVRDMLEVMNAWYAKLEHHTQNLRCFRDFLDFVLQDVPDCDLEHLIALLFFVGMSKRSKLQRTKQFCRLCEQRFLEAVTSGKAGELHTTAITLFAVNLHKLNYILSSKMVLLFLANHVMRLTTNIRSFKRGCFFDMIACIKVLRHAHFCPDHLCVRMARLISDHGKDLNATELYHLIAVLANANFYDRRTLRLAETRLVEELRLREELGPLTPSQAHPSELMRVKDVEGLVWACAHLGHVFKATTAEDVKRFLLKNYVPDQWKVSTYVDAVYSLVMMGFHFEDLAHVVMDSSVVAFLRRRKQSRMLVKMWIIESAMNIELGMHLDVVCGTITDDDVPKRPLGKDLSERRSLKCAFMELQAVATTSGDFKVYPSYTIPRISVAGLIMEYQGQPDRTVFVEILDSKVGTRPYRHPIGLMSLKLRLMRCEKLAVVLLSEEEARMAGPDLLDIINCRAGGESLTE